MVHQVKFRVPVQRPGHPDSRNLPKEIVEIQSPWPSLPNATPLRQIMIVKMNARDTSTLCTLDHVTIIASSEYMNHVPAPGYRSRPIPADSRLRSFEWLARIGGEKNLHANLVGTNRKCRRVALVRIQILAKPME